MTFQDLGSVVVKTKQPRVWSAPEHRPAWPTVIGIIAIVLGGLGVLVGLCGVIKPLLAGLTAVADVPLAERPTFEVTQHWRGWTIPLSLLSALVAAGLVLAGSLLALRRAQARQWCLTWAAAKLVLVIVWTVVNYRIAREIVAATAAQTTHAARIAAVAGRQFAEVSTTVGLFFGVAWGMALPVFLLIWLRREQVRDEVVRWRW